MSAPRLVLASASPRRAALLAQLGLTVEVRPAQVDESYLAGETPAEHVDRLARVKAETVARSADSDLVVGGDTVVLHDGRVMGKPADETEAARMLRSLSGMSHDVLSGVAITHAAGTVSRVVRTEVCFRAIDDAEIRCYVASGEPLDKAGAYGIQGLGAALVEEIRGDYYCVVGFPVAAFLDLLSEVGWRYAFGRLDRIERATPPR